MGTGATTNILLLYIPGMDLRNLSESVTPFLSQALQDYSWAEIRTQPSPEQLSTVLTGMNPHDHGIWQMKLVRSAVANQRSRTIWERLPDLLTTTYQCARHQIFHDCDVPTLPPARRKSFEMRRLKLHGRRDTDEVLKQLGDVPSIVTHLGKQQCEYTFTDRLGDFDTAANRVAKGNVKLEFVHMHAVDMMGHWVLDTPQKLRSVYRRADDLIEVIADKCQRNGITMFAATDHGQERVTADIDLRRKISELDLDPVEFSYYLQPITARFWFHTARARQKIMDLLTATGHGTLITFLELEQFDIKFSQPSYGEVYFLADPGYLFFPHDFHHPLVNLVFGLKDSQQRRRLVSPRHTAYHGYLPHYESEKGWIVCLNQKFQFQKKEIKLIDLMPSMLSLLGEAQPQFMTGRNQIRF